MQCQEAAGWEVRGQPPDPTRAPSAGVGAVGAQKEAVVTACSTGAWMKAGLQSCLPVGRRVTSRPFGPRVQKGPSHTALMRLHTPPQVCTAHTRSPSPGA